MAKKKLLEDIKARPGRFYRVPGDVMRDRRFGDAERLEILRAWRGRGDAELAPADRRCDRRTWKAACRAADHAAE